MMKRVAVLCFGLLITMGFAASQLHASVFDVKKYGAVGDGKALDSPAINKAIDAASAAGGGTVYFTAGTYLSGSIHLKSNITLYLDQGATIQASPDPEAYDPIETSQKQWDKYQDFGHTYFHNSLIWGEGLENIAILGPGVISGKDALTRKADQRIGNKAISLKLCRNVVIRDVSILMAGHFAILATGVDNFTIDNIKIDTNRDGIDVDSCRHVRISNTSVNSPADDGIVIKGTHALGFARATEDMTITNCEVSGFQNGTFLDGTYKRGSNMPPQGHGPTGRIKIGTESEGSFRNITISNCVFDYSRGLALETVDGADLEDISITNITMRDIVNAPIYLRLGARMRAPEGVPIGSLRRVNISNIVVYNADRGNGSLIMGIPGHDIEDVKLSNIRIYYQGGGTKEQAAINPPEEEKEYPEPYRHGDMPSYGFFIRHAKGIEFTNVEVSTIKEDLRPAFVLEDVKGAEFNLVKAQHAPQTPIFSLKEVKDFSLFHSGSLPDTKLESVKEKQF
ncbi:MAG TPA: glycoside hydrolase family 28 protein [Terriglobales bacterium]|nr:glycoside hydrolase family 28 protein [Terriglobales bacterium]